MTGKWLLLSLLALPSGADILITGGQADDASLFIVNYVTRERAFIQDLGMISGGLDKDRPAGEDKATLILQRPNGYDARNGFPTIAAFALQALAGQELKGEISLALGSTMRNTDIACLYWNGELLAEIDGRHDRVQTVRLMTVKDFAFTVPSSRVRAENTLAVMPKNFHGELLLVDAVRIAGDVKLLPLEKARSLLAGTPLYEPRDLKGKGRVLVIDRMRSAFGLYEFEIVRALNADYDAYPRDGSPYDAWLSPARWSDYKAVLLSTTHKLTTEENQAIQDYVESGGLLIVSGDTLTSFFVQNSQVLPGQAAWTGGYLGGPVKYAQSETVTFTLKEGPCGLPGSPPAGPNELDRQRRGHRHVPGVLRRPPRR